MSTRTPPPPGYSFVSYPAEYAYSPCSCPGPHIDTQTAYSPQCYMPPSPGIHGTHTPPTSPDRYSPHSHSHSHSSGSSASLEKAEIKAMRQLCAAITKMQGSMKDMAERQEQILDRMSLLEQRVGRMDDSIEKLLENTEAALEDSKAIRGKLEDSEGTADDFETRLSELMDGSVKKLMGNIGKEIQEIKKSVQDTQRYVKFDPFSWTNRMVMAQRMTEAAVLGEQPQKEAFGV